MGLNFDKHREHLEKDIREALQHVFGENFEIIDIQKKETLKKSILKN